MQPYAHLLHHSTMPRNERPIGDHQVSTSGSGREFNRNKFEDLLMHMLRIVGPCGRCIDRLIDNALSLIRRLLGLWVLSIEV